MRGPAAEPIDTHTGTLLAVIRYDLEIIEASDAPKRDYRSGFWINSQGNE